MKNIYIFLLLLLPLYGTAQQIDADALLDDIVARMKAEAPLQMDYSYTMYDDDNRVVLKDKGVMKLDGERYALIMDKMGVWCDGETQWSYMLEINEIYITDSSSDEAQSLSPLSIIENYREGCTKTVNVQNGVAVISLETPSGSDIEKVVLSVDTGNYHLKAMDVFMPNQGYMEIMLDKYQIKCNFVPDDYKCPVEEYDTAEIVDMR